MRTASVRDLRNKFGMLEAWLIDGEEVRIERRGQPIAILRPLATAAEKAGVAGGMPDFAARQRAIWGERVLGEVEVEVMREAELDGEEG